MNWKLLYNLRPETYNLPPNSAQENFVSCHILARTSLWSPQIPAQRHSHARGINMNPKAELLQREEDTHELGLRLQKPTLQLAERKGNLALTPRCRLILKPSSKFQTGNCHFDFDIHLLTLILVWIGSVRDKFGSKLSDPYNPSLDNRCNPQFAISRCNLSVTEVESVVATWTVRRHSPGINRMGRWMGASVTDNFDQKARISSEVGGKVREGQAILDAASTLHRLWC